MSHREAVAKATADINRILQQLESETGLIVSDIGLHRIETTTMHDSGQRHRISSTIEVERQPSHDWAT